MVKRLLLAASVLGAVGASPAYAVLQLSISANGSTFTCFDGELSCDLSGASKNLLTVDTSVGGAFVQLTLATSSFGAPDALSLSSSNIINESGAPISITLIAGDTGFVAPVNAITESSSLTFADAVGSGASFERFWADPADVQGADPTNTPGTLLFTASGTPTTNPDSFDGTNESVFAAVAPFSMTEAAQLNLIAGGSITGFNQEMRSAIPEPSTWAMLGVGFAMMAFLGLRRRSAARLAAD